MGGEKHEIYVSDCFGVQAAVVFLSVWCVATADAPPRQIGFSHRGFAV